MPNTASRLAPTEATARVTAISSLIDSARNRPPWQIAAGVAGVILLVLGGYWFMAEGPGARIISPPESVVAEFTGTGDDVTESFDVRRGWRMDWSTTGDAMTIAIRGDQNMGTVVTTDEPASGTTDPPAGGVFHLEVGAEGDWTVTILQGD